MAIRKNTPVELLIQLKKGTVLVRGTYKRRDTSFIYLADAELVGTGSSMSSGLGAFADQCAGDQLGNLLVGVATIAMVRPAPVNKPPPPKDVKETTLVSTELDGFLDDEEFLL